MTAKGHVLLASIFAYPLTAYMIDKYGIQEATVIYFAIIIGSLVPDIDEPNSYIGSRFKLIAYVLNIIGVRHRTVTHWLIFPICVAFFGYLINNQLATPIIYAVALGIFLHDVGDMLTKGGINGFFFPFFPRTKTALLPYSLRFETFSVFEYFFVLFLFFLNAYIYFRLINNKEIYFAYFQKFISSSGL